MIEKEYYKIEKTELLELIKSSKMYEMYIAVGVDNWQSENEVLENCGLSEEELAEYSTDEYYLKNYEKL